MHKNNIMSNITMKNYMLASILLLQFTTNGLFAQTQPPAYGTVTRFYEKSLVGYKNSNGDIVVAAKYTAGSEMYRSPAGGGYALVLVGRKRGFINEKGEVIIPFIYDDASVFHDGLARVMKDGKHGYINVNGETIIPFLFDVAFDFGNGLARVKKNGRFGFIDTKGNAVIELKFKNALDFSEGLAPVMNDENKWGFIDASGKYVIRSIYEQAQLFQNGEAAVKLNGKLFVIGHNGKKLREVETAEHE